MRSSFGGGNTGRSSMGGSAKQDPYDLNFKALRDQYVRDSNIKIPFVKSSFIHYAACPLTLEIDEQKLKNELVLTMELV